jgi:hypothetical protein
MRFMNEYDVEDALARFDPDVTPNRVRAAENLARLVEWTNSNSDGWPYWTKPARAAAKVMDLLEGDGTWADRNRLESEDCTAAELAKALAPI